MRRARLVITVIIVLLGFYGLSAYVVIPFFWEQYAGHHPAFGDSPRITRTSDGHPGDPLNVGLVGTAAEIRGTMTAANWYEAKPLGPDSDVKIVADTLLGRPDDQAPVSSLYLFGRKEDLAFEKPVGDSPDKRNHVRLWRTDSDEAGGIPVWIGAASYDERVGLSHTTGQVTHHIGADVDTERDRLMSDLKATGRMQDIYTVSGFHETLRGRNGGGDPWYTDGDLLVGIISNE